MFVQLSIKMAEQLTQPTQPTQPTSDFVHIDVTRVGDLYLDAMIACAHERGLGKMQEGYLPVMFRQVQVSECTFKDLTDEEYRKKLAHFLIKYSCKYCKKVTHDVSDCHVLATRTCGRCGKTGHTESKCMHKPRDTKYDIRKLQQKLKTQKPPDPR
jgi:hypothetical protein